jgi:DNA gyrase subunit B
LVLVTPDDARHTQEVFELLLGENLAGRKVFIAEEGHKYLDLTDIS